MTADRAQFIAGLRHLASTLEKHPALRLPYDGTSSPMAFYFLGPPDPTHDEWLQQQYLWRAAEKTLPCPFTQSESGDTTRLTGGLGGPDGLRVELVARTHGPARFCPQCGTANPHHTACCPARPGAEPVAVIVAEHVAEGAL